MAIYNGSIEFSPISLVSFPYYIAFTRKVWENSIEPFLNGMENSPTWTKNGKVPYRATISHGDLQWLYRILPNFATKRELLWHDYEQNLGEFYGAVTELDRKRSSWLENDKVLHRITIFYGNLQWLGRILPIFAVNLSLVELSYSQSPGEFHGAVTELDSKHSLLNEKRPSPSPNHHILRRFTTAR
jgi:hypothetical protein